MGNDVGIVPGNYPLNMFFPGREGTNGYRMVIFGYSKQTVFSGSHQRNITIIRSAYTGKCPPICSAALSERSFPAARADMDVNTKHFIEFYICFHTGIF